MTQDEREGMEWWNALSEADRRFWLACAVSAKPADAWAAYKRARAAAPPPMHVDPPCR